MTGRGFKTTPAEHRVAALPATPTAKKSSARLSDSYIDTIWDQLRDKPNAFPILIRDTETKGFQIRIGRRRLAWQFEHERSDHGKRIYTCKALGFFDPACTRVRPYREAWHVDCDTARKAATISRASPTRHRAGRQARRG